MINHAGLELHLQEEGSDTLGFMTLLVVFDLTFPLTIPPTSIPEGSLLANLEYRIRADAPPGQATLRNETNQFSKPGFPPVANIFTTERLEIQPVLGSGSVNVLGGAGIDCNGNSRLSVGSAAGVSGEVQVELRGNSVCEVEGFQLAVGHDPSRVEFVRAIPGPFVLEHAGANALVDAEEHNSSGYMKLFVAFDFAPPFTVPPTSIGSNTLLATLVYNILPGAESGQVLLRNEDSVFGFPRVENVFLGEDDLIDPVLSSGSITVVGQVECDANADLSLGTTSGESGEVQVQIRGSSVCEVNGFSMAIGHDPLQVAFVRATPGSFLSGHAGSNLLFLAEAHNDVGFMKLFGVFNASPFSQVPPTSIPPSALLATLTYRILPGASGQVVLRNQDQAFGNPPTPNIYTTDGVAISPVLSDGAIFIGGSGDCDANAVFAVGNASAASGNVQVELRGSSVCDVTGLTLAIGHDRSRVEFVSATPGPFLTGHAGAELVFIAEPRNSQGFALFFANLDASFPFTVPPTSIPPNTLLATLTYSILPGAPAGQVILTNDDQAFGFDNMFTTTEGGQIRPVLVDGSITVGSGPPPPPPPPPPPTGDFTMQLKVPPSVEFTQGQFDVQLIGSSTRALRGFSALIGYDSDVLSVVSSRFTSTIWEDSDFASVSDDGAGRLRIGVVHDRDGIPSPTSPVVKAGEDLVFLNLKFDGRCPGSTTLSFVGSIDDNLLVDEDLVGHDAGNGLGLTGAAVSLEGGFVRGNANGGVVNMADPAASVDLADGLFILAFLFQAGAPPACEDAADANDDGRINLLDAIFVFQFLVGGLDPELPAPFVSAGVDPTQDTLNCEVRFDGESCGQP